MELESLSISNKASEYSRKAKDKHCLLCKGKVISGAGWAKHHKTQHGD
jgi:hypothetical protein